MPKQKQQIRRHGPRAVQSNETLCPTWSEGRQSQSCDLAALGSLKSPKLITFLPVISFDPRRSLELCSWSECLATWKLKVYIGVRVEHLIAHGPRTSVARCSQVAAPPDRCRCRWVAAPALAPAPHSAGDGAHGGLVFVTAEVPPSGERVRVRLGLKPRLLAAAPLNPFRNDSSRLGLQCWSCDSC